MDTPETPRPKQQWWRTKTAAPPDQPHHYHCFYPLLQAREHTEGRRIAVREVAEASGMGRSALADWASGRTQVTSDRLLAGLCAYFGATPQDLLVRVSSGTPPPATHVETGTERHRGRPPREPIVPGPPPLRYSAYQFQPTLGPLPALAVTHEFKRLLWQRQIGVNRPIPVQEVAGIIGISDVGLAEWFNGQTKETPDRLLDALCAYFACTPRDVLTVAPVKAAGVGAATSLGEPPDRSAR